MFVHPTPFTFFVVHSSCFLQWCISCYIIFTSVDWTEKESQKYIWAYATGHTFFPAVSAAYYACRDLTLPLWGKTILSLFFISHPLAFLFLVLYTSHYVDPRTWILWTLTGNSFSLWLWGCVKLIP